MYCKCYELPDEDALDTIVTRPSFDASSIEKTVDAVLARVKAEGDAALFALAQEFDHTTLDEQNLFVSEEEMQAGEDATPAEVKAAIAVAARNIRAFHEAQMPKGECVETAKGVVCSRKIIPIQRVGLYIPGGTAPLFSTILMLAIPAMVAGCPTITLATPARNGVINPAILYAAKYVGIRRVLKVGGAQAIAAFAYGTKSIEKVDKIFGPGNRYVALAKARVSATCAIDMVAGPSEVMVVADKAADPDYVATDLLSQAEHGPDSQVVLVVKAESLEEGRVIAERIDSSLVKAIGKLGRREYLQSSLSHSSLIIELENEKVLRDINRYAPEHLILNTLDAEALLDGVVNAGSVFLGPYSPESAGDYASGTNHTLPTSGWARSSGGVSVDSFLKKMTIQRLTKEGITALSPVVITMAKAEALSAHALAAEVRLEK